jgi:hypothetical protein
VRTVPCLIPPPPRVRDNDPLAALGEDAVGWFVDQTIHEESEPHRLS